jgi:hypothetical protein
MLSHLSQWILIAAISQAPPEAALLKSIPADVDLVFRVGSLESARTDALALLKSMNPEWAKMAEDGLAGPMADIRQKHGEAVIKTPWATFIRLSDGGGDGGPPPFVVVIGSDDYNGVMKGFNGGKDVDLKHQDGGFDAFDGPEGQGTWYAAKRPGAVAFGSSKNLIADIAKPGTKTLDSVLTKAAAKTFLAGDIGIYVNAAALTSRYADQIDQVRQGLMAAMDQAAQQVGNASTIQVAKEFYGGLFDSLKEADILTADLDLGEKGLEVAGFVKVKTDSNLAKSIAEIRTGTAPTLVNLPANALAYIYANVGAKTFDRLHHMSLRMMNPEGKPSPELEKAIAALHGMGRVESTGAVSMEKGMRSISDIRVDDPRKFLDAILAMLRAVKAGEGQVKLYKEVKIEPDVQSHEGLKFTHAVLTMDLEELAKLSGNKPEQAEMMKVMLGDGTMNYWYGIDDKRLLQVMAPTWEDAKAQIDSYLSGKDGIGQTAGFRSVRSELPEQASLLVLVSSQGLVRMFATLFAALAKNPDLKVPDDMPKEPALLGLSLTPHPSEGFELHLVLPSQAGSVIAKGMVPVFQGIAASRPVR